MEHSSQWRGIRRFGSANGFTVAELLIAVVMISVLTTIAWPRLLESRIRTEVRHAGDDFISVLNRARSEALRGTGLTRLHTDSNSGRMFVTSDTSWGGGAPLIPVGLQRDVTNRRVTMAATRDFICFNAQGFPTRAFGCPPGDLTVVFSRDTRVDTISITSAGKVFR